MADLYGIRCWNAEGQLTLDISDRITHIIWNGMMTFPRDSRTGPNWPNQSNNNFTNASTSMIIESDAFLNGTPFVFYHDHNGKYASNSSMQMAGIQQNLSWSMLSGTRMNLVYMVFSPGWSRNDVITRYNNVDIPLMIGIY